MVCPVVLKSGSLKRRWLHLLLGEKTSTWPSLKEIRAAAGWHTKEEGLTGSYLKNYFVSLSLLSKCATKCVILLGKPSNEKSGLVMEFFRKGFDPPPLFLEVMEPVGHICKKWPEHSL